MTYGKMASYILKHWPFAKEEEVKQRLCDARITYTRKTQDRGTLMMRRSNARLWLAHTYEMAYKRETGKTIRVNVDIG